MGCTHGIYLFFWFMWVYLYIYISIYLYGVYSISMGFTNQGLVSMSQIDLQSKMVHRIFSLIFSHEEHGDFSHRYVSAFTRGEMYENVPMFQITELGRGYKFQPILEGHVKQITQKGHLPSPVHGAAGCEYGGRSGLPVGCSRTIESAADK